MLMAVGSCERSALVTASESELSDCNDGNVPAVVAALAPGTAFANIAWASRVGGTAGDLVPKVDPRRFVLARVSNVSASGQRAGSALNIFRSA
jgi:hypothetical protein